MYSTGKLVTALFGLTLALSIQEAASLCPIGALPEKANATHDGVACVDAPVGAIVTYTCMAGFRIAPDSTPILAETARIVTCTASGAFEDLDFECVHIFPSSCRDYFTRDGLFATMPDGTCYPVTLQHADSTTSEVECCKRDASRFRTRISISPSVPHPIDESGICTDNDASDIMPGVTFDGTISTLCDPATPVTYVIPPAQIAKAVATTRGCSQRVRFNCYTGGGSISKAIIIRYNGDDVGTLYGTNAFPEQGVNIDLSHYGNTGAACDCALQPIEVDPAGTCANGCHCTQMGAVATARDYITRDGITSTNLKYVVAVRVSQHDNAGTTGPTTIEVRDIQCDEDL